MSKPYLAALAAPITLIACAPDGETAADHAPAANRTAAAPAATVTESATPDATSQGRNADDARADRAPLQAEIPARFRGTYAESLDQCDNPSHGLFTVRADMIDFFESNGEVRNVRAEGDYAAATVFEQYGDSPGTTYAFYMRLLPDGRLRYRYDDNERLTWVRWPVSRR